MYQVPLIQFINKEHELYQLADRINWDEIEQDLTEYYCVDNGRPSIHQKLLPDQEPVVAFWQFLVSEDIPLPIREQGLKIGSEFFNTCELSIFTMKFLISHQ
jgi:hypothetical protein